MNASSSELDRKLCRILCDHPKKHNNRYTAEAKQDLLESLFRALTNDRDDRIQALFPPDGVLPASGRLQEAQGSEEGTEYLPGAKGKPCGHILKAGEATYHCMTCTDDATCCLCARCFNASDHEGHQFTVNPSPGNNGCCDCGDFEAFKRPVNCAIHTATEDEMQQDPRVCLLPEDLQRSITTTVARALDYFCDVISCSPENLRLLKTPESIRHDESSSRLSEKWYSPGDEHETNPEYALVLWNDEKHTVDGVQQQVARACRESLRFGLKHANETNDTGRTVIRHSRNIQELIRMCRILEQIKITVTIRSSRDTFREQMCGTIIEWLSDIASCSIQGDHRFLRDVVCQEMVKEWRIGSEAPNAMVGRAGQFDNEREDHDYLEAFRRRRDLLRQGHVLIAQQNIILNAFDDDDDDDDDDEEQRPMDENDNDEAEGDGEDAEDEDEDDEQNDNNLVRPQIGILTQPMMTLDDIIMTRAMITEADSGNEGLDGVEEGEEPDTDGDFMDVDNPTENGAANQQPPPPPPNVIFTPIESEPEDLIMRRNQRDANTATPKIPDPDTTSQHEFAPEHWKIGPSEYLYERQDPLAASDTIERMRLDSLILFDLRLWKETRVKIRDLLISTVVNVGHFKRILGIRFAILYTVLSQLYLVADREPDHSVIHLSLQMLTSPSITEEVIEKGNFLTTLMAILYTFLTTRQVGYPKDVDSQATLAFDTGSVTNRRLLSSFNDLRFILASDFVQRKVRSDPRYLKQFLDLAKLSQGICPNTRAVGEHVEYETDAWINAALLTKEMNKLCRQFAECYREKGTKKASTIDQTCVAIFDTACVVIVNSIGLERKRFTQSEIKEVTRFKALKRFEFETRRDAFSSTEPHRIVDFVVQNGALSFHRALHYTLSWLVEFGKSSPQALEALNVAATTVVQDLQKVERGPQGSTFYMKDDALLAMFDYPLRLCAWLAQMKAGMWVRNGASLRHQGLQYRGVSHRDVGHHRDLVLLQTALIACDPARVLASMIDRYGLEDWMRGNFTSPAWREDGQSIDMAEEFIFLLINLLSDRDSLIFQDDEMDPQMAAVRKDIVHTLCFKPLSFSELHTRLTERQDPQKLHDVLETMTTYRAPEGLHDAGMFELKPEFLRELDPYNSNFSKNQRDEAEAIYRQWTSKSTGKAPEDIVLEPNLRPIRSGIFVQLAEVTRTPLFAQVIYYCLEYGLEARFFTPDIPATRVEALLHVVLQLALIATLEDELDEDFPSSHDEMSFVHHALNLGPSAPRRSRTAIITILQQISHMEEYESCRAKIKHLLRMFVRKREAEFKRVTAHLEFPYGRLDTASPANLESEVEAKKKQAMERKAKVMAQFQQQQQTFLNNQASIDWGEDDFSDTEIETPSATEAHPWKFPSGVCIHCREDVSADCRMYGTFAMTVESGILRQTPDPLEESGQSTAKGRSNEEDRSQGSVYVREILQAPPSLDISIEETRPFGISGWNHERVKKLKVSGEEIEIDRQCLGRGWPKAETTDSRIMTSCGHIMHFACFTNYYASVTRRQSHQISRNHPERLWQLEFVCPLCKAAGNTFLPIAWKSLEQSYPGVLQPQVSFEDALEVVGEREASFEYGKPEERYQQNQDAARQLISTFLSSRSGLAVNTSSRETRNVAHNTTEQHNSRDLSLSELRKIFLRLRENLAISVNAPNRVDNLEEHIGVLVSCFANTITATEIAHRGLMSEHGYTLLSKVPSQTLTHLKILASGIKLYIADRPIGGLDSGAKLTSIQRQKYTQLFYLFKEHGDKGIWELTTKPYLMQDSFSFLAEASAVLYQVSDLEPHHLLRICYTAELIRVLLAFRPAESSYRHTGLSTLDSSNEQSPQIWRGIADFREFCAFEEGLWRSRALNPIAQESLASFTMGEREMLEAQALSQLLRQYATAFLRKAVILFNVAHNVDFPPMLSVEHLQLPELERLSQLLNIPSIEAILSEFSPYSGQSPIKRLVRGWMSHYFENSLTKSAERTGRYEESWYLDPDRVETPSSILEASAKALRNRPGSTIYLRIPLLHPCPLELIGLPKYFDVLMDIAHQTPCPTTGKDLTDAAMCLFCGEMICAQAVCCKRNKRGGCNRHITETRCGGGTIGMFLFVRKCMVALLHVVPMVHGRRGYQSNGSWFNAPYLTKHGEHDPGLRSREQLILSQKRYDKLYRDAWLCVRGGSEVWSMIARRLEGDVNHGGWETL